MQAQSEPTRLFHVKNCSLATIATGERANSLLELRDKLATVDERCLYHHFWGARMSPQFVHLQHHNDFANWIYYRLHDYILSEQLNVMDPKEFNSLEALRQELLETIERRLDDYEFVIWIKKEHSFHFIRSTTIVFDSMVTISRPEDLANAIRLLPPGSIFYHFIDARSRTEEKMDDFSMWLKIFGNQYQDLIQEIQAIDPYFLSLTELRNELANSIQKYLETRKLI